MTKHCSECKQPLTFAERWGIRKHVCDNDVLAALAYKQQEEHKQYLERKRIKQEAYKRSYTSPVRSSSGSSRRVSSSDDSYNYAVMNAFSPSYSSYSSVSSSCDSSSSSDSGSCSSGD